nr:unnamed protein product [Spirometra erinaceieuropaei]
MMELTTAAISVPPPDNRSTVVSTLGSIAPSGPTLASQHPTNESIHSDTNTSTPSAAVTAHPAQTHKIQDDNNQRSNDKKSEEKKKSCSKKVEGHEQQIPRNASEEPEPGTSASVSPITGNDMGPKTLNLSQKTSDFDENANKTETNEDINRLQLISSSDHGNHILPMSEHETTVFSRVSPVRGQCLIIQGLPESTAGASKERVSADLKLFQCLLNELLRPNEEVSVLKAFRLGKRSIDISEHSRPRPLKIVLANQEQVGLILSRRFRIKDTNRGVFLQPDYTPAERIKRRQLVLELRTRLQNGETDLVIYNNQIVQRPPLIRWTEPIRMRAQ